jgi:hypothetical protein
MSTGHTDRAGARSPRVLLWLLVPVLLALWVQRRALGSFFAADDLIHLEQARGILPTLLLPWRALTQVLYFRGMLARPTWGCSSLSSIA